MLKASISLVFHKLRLSKPWNYKAPFLIAVPYLIIAMEAIPFNQAFPSIIASLMTILGIAGFGYFINDLTDIDKDLSIGKPNAVANLTSWQRTLLLLFLLFLAIAPWFYFPVSALSVFLLAIEFLLFVFYSFPPFRLKEKGIFGVMTDALYAHAIPVLLAAITFLLISGESNIGVSYFLIVLVLWQFILGVRNILIHQIKDYANDLNSGTKTYVQGLGVHKTRQWLKYLIVPIEFILFILFILVANQNIPYLLLSAFFYIPYTVWRMKVLWRRDIPKNLIEILNYFFDGFYIEWVPLVVLGVLVCQSQIFLFLLILHILIFNNGVKNLFRDLKNLF